MVVKQYFNKKTNRWVKGKICKNPKTGGKYLKITGVKKKEKTLPWKNISKG